MSKKSQEKYRAAGLCILCGNTKPLLGRQCCQSCGEKRKTYSNNRVKKRIESGKCCKCGENDLVTKRHCGPCAELHYASTRKSYAIVKDLVFLAYGGYICKCCGETEKAFLTIDHIENNGAEHRRQIGNGNFYRWIVANNYPPDFQVLCMNCQWGKKKCGICPHQISKQNEQTR